MILLKTLLLGFLTGLAAFFPVSSVGTLIIGAHMFSVPVDQRLFAAMMLGIFLVLVLSYYSDIIRLFYSLVSIFRDLIYNLKLYVTARGSEADYRRILTGNYRNFLVMLLTALIPTVKFSTPGYATSTEHSTGLSGSPPGLTFAPSLHLNSPPEEEASQNLNPRETKQMFPFLLKSTHSKIHRQISNRWKRTQRKKAITMGSPSLSLGSSSPG